MSRVSDDTNHATEPRSEASAKILLGQFLRRRREALTPEDLGLPRGARRRADGLRREEVAEVCGVSVDYIARLERGSGPWPSSQVLSALVRGLRLSRAEQNYLFALCGRLIPASPPGEHIDSRMQRMLDRLRETPALVFGQAGSVLGQTPAALALYGDFGPLTGLQRSVVYRWFAEPDHRLLYVEEDRERIGRALALLLREDLIRLGDGLFASSVLAALLAQSEEFARIWERREVGLRLSGQHRYQHPLAGRIDLDCQMLFDADSGQTLLVYTAAPGTADAERAARLGTKGAAA